MDIRTLRSAEELREVHDLELEIWGDESAEDRVSVLMLLVSTRIGGLVIGAFDAGRLVGVVYALPGIRDGKPYQWSHMMGVRAKYRNCGLGYRLKIEQRRQVVASGLDLIAWTYDPLQAMNAHLNFTKLGVVAKEYHPDAYPGSASPLHAGTPTDRLVADWWLRSERVAGRLGEQEGQGAVRPETWPRDSANRVREEGGWLVPAGHDLSLDAPRIGITIPMGFTEMQQQHLPRAREWRAATREMFTTYLARGYRVTDFLLDRSTGRGCYLLSRLDDE